MASLYKEKELVKLPTMQHTIAEMGGGGGGGGRANTRWKGGGPTRTDGVETQRELNRITHPSPQAGVADSSRPI